MFQSSRLNNDSDDCFEFLNEVACIVGMELSTSLILSLADFFSAHRNHRDVCQSCLSIFVCLEMSLFCILFLMYCLMIQVSSSKSSSWIACTASKMVYFALSIYFISSTRHSYWSVILSS